VSVSKDPVALKQFIASQPDLKPSSDDAGCEALDLLELDLPSNSAKVFHTITGGAGCGGDPAETYVEVKDGAVVRSLTCAEVDQAGECAAAEKEHSRWAGEQVTMVGIAACSEPTGVCVTQVSTRTRT
jgi:hypothetical protein